MPKLKVFSAFVTSVMDYFAMDYTYRPIQTMVNTFRLEYLKKDGSIDKRYPTVVCKEKKPGILPHQYLTLELICAT